MGGVSQVGGSSESVKQYELVSASLLLREKKAQEARCLGDLLPTTTNTKALGCNREKEKALSCAMGLMSFLVKRHGL